MWIYEDVTREQFERAKDKVELLLKEAGAEEFSVSLPYEQKTSSYYGKDNDDVINHVSTRPVYKYKDEYYRVDEVCFGDKPFIVLEVGTYDELMKNIMEDLDPFPYDLSDGEMKLEVEYSLGIKPYPKR